jgi:hypothetical protein
MEFESNGAFEVIFYRDGEQIDGSLGTVTVRSDYVVFDVAEIWSSDELNWVSAGGGMGPDEPVNVPFALDNGVLTVTLEEGVVVPLEAMEFGIREELVANWDDTDEPFGIIQIGNNGRYYYSADIEETGTWDASPVLFRNVAEERDGVPVSIGYVGEYELGFSGPVPALIITYGVGIDAATFTYTIAPE